MPGRFVLSLSEDVGMCEHNESATKDTKVDSDVKRFRQIQELQQMGWLEMSHTKYYSYEVAEMVSPRRIYNRNV